MPISRKTKVSLKTRMDEHPGVFREDKEVMFCNFCDLSVEWKSKSTVDGHCRSQGHIKKKQIYEINEQKKKQVTITSINAASESKKEVIEDLIKVFSLANIPLEKVNHLLPFFKKYLKEGGAIPQAPTLRQIYLPRVFNNHFSLLQSYFNQKPVAIIMDETTDDCSRSVVNTLFVFRQNTKLVSVNFLERVNNSTMGGTLLSILSDFNIPFTLPILFLSDSAAYMKKCYREALKPIMPQLIHVPCCAHIINLIGDTWRTFSDFSLLRTLLSKIKETFVHSPARKGRYLTHLRMHGIKNPCKIPLPNATRWNSWFKMVFYAKDFIKYWPSFYYEEHEKDKNHEAISKIHEMLQNEQTKGIITICINFIACYAQEFVQDLNFFQQQNKPVFPFVEGRLEQLTSYMEGNRIAQHFGSDMHDLITQYLFNPDDFYNIFRSAFNLAYNKFTAHIPQHPARSLFRASRVFDPLYIKVGIQIGDTSRNDIRQYSAIMELCTPSDELLREWAIYCGSVNEIIEEQIDLNLYWVGMQSILTILSNIALNYIWLPISSCSVERSFSMYNNLLNSDRQNLSCESLKQLSMLYFNGNDEF